MANDRPVDFGVLFRTMWQVFTSNYPFVLGVAVLLIVISIVVAAVTQVVGFSLASNEEPGALGPVMIALCVNLVLSLLITIPILAYLYYAVLKRARSSTEPPKSGRYGVIVALGLFQLIFLCPGLFVMSAGNPGQYSNVQGSMNVLKSFIGAAIADANSPETRAELNEAVQERRKTDVPMNPSLLLLGYGLLLVGGLVALVWCPWSFIAALDPRVEPNSAGGALRYVRELNAPVRASMYGAFIVTTLIAGASFALCCLPGVFFGTPLFAAGIPAFYMAMRGESVGASEPELG